MAVTDPIAALLAAINTRWPKGWVKPAEVAVMLDAQWPESAAAVRQHATDTPNAWLVPDRIEVLVRREAMAKAPPAPAPALVHGLDAQAWFDTARRYHAGLRTIAFTWGHGIDHQWARDQARWYLGEQAGMQAWAMPDAPDLVQIVVPRSGPPEARITPVPLATIAAGEEFTLEIQKPADAEP